MLTYQCMLNFLSFSFDVFHVIHLIGPIDIWEHINGCLYWSYGLVILYNIDAVSFPTTWIRDPLN